MPVLALFGITNSGLNLFVNLVVLFLVVVWIALIAWTYLDARRRIEDPVLVACATGASLFPFVGSIVYSILRPPEFLEDAKERELEIRASELRVRQLEEQSCPNCGHPIERTYLRCPNCRARVKDPCDNCERPIDPRWLVCPYCEMPSAGRRSHRAGPPARSARASSDPRAPPRDPLSARRRALPRALKPRRPRDRDRRGQPAASPAPNRRHRGSESPRRGDARAPTGAATAARRTGHGGHRRPSPLAHSPPCLTSPGR